ncbi:hypothetical protein [Photobacterium kishitanii]|uniref:hypothetical protein n=1 Tax=Photobacterium kishitanii TaxID=318456 RepID=UPI0011B1F07D|nr:hypothetical protein [Photobacterium kishitanii]
MLDAMLAITLVAGSMAFRARVEANYHKDEIARAFSTDIANIIYGMDKRVLLDGSDMTSPAISVTGSENAYNQIKKELIGKNNSDCSGGAWNPRDPVNSQSSLINCHALNPHKLPFGLQMDFSTKTKVTPGTTNGVLTSMAIDFYSPSVASFDKNFTAYLKVPELSKVMDTPQITGSHRYVLVERSTNREITPVECDTLKTGCAIRAELVSNEGGVSESPYLRVNGDNFMIGDLKFQSNTNPSTALKCYKVDANSGAPIETTCGISLKNGKTEAVNSSTFSDGFYLSDGNVAVKCKGESGANESCGLTPIAGHGGAILRATVVSSNDIVFHNKLKNTNNSFNVNAAGFVNAGNVLSNNNVEAANKIFVKNGSAFVGKDGIYSFADPQNTNMNVKNSNAVVNANLFEVNGHAMVVNSMDTTFNGNIIKKNAARDDVAGAKTDGQIKTEYMTKQFFAGYSQITKIIPGAQTGRRYNKTNRCINGGGASEKAFFIPDKIVGRSKRIDDYVCPYAWGQRVALWRANTTAFAKTSSWTDGSGYKHDEYAISAFDLKATKSCDLSMNGWQDSGVRAVSGNAFVPYADYYTSSLRGKNNQAVDTSGTLIMFCPPSY